VVAKLGADGAQCSLSSQVWSLPAHPTVVLDTVGAGDAFVAGYLSQRLANESPERSLLRGVICGALACTQLGDWEGTPTREEITALEKGVLV
jgi:2-dehydro-3-deoxygluconokinase